MSVVILIDVLREPFARRDVVERARRQRHRALELPEPLADVGERARFILDIDAPLLVDRDGVAQWAGLGQRLQEMARLSAAVMPDLPDQLERVSVALRLWAGCLMAAKAIREEILSGPNTEAGRAEQSAEIDGLCETDPLFRAGVEAAPAFLGGRGQRYYFDGVPATAPVRRHADAAD